MRKFITVLFIVLSFHMFGQNPKCPFLEYPTYTWDIHHGMLNVFASVWTENYKKALKIEDCFESFNYLYYLLTVDFSVNKTNNYTMLKMVNETNLTLIEELNDYELMRAKELRRQTVNSYERMKHLLDSDETDVCIFKNVVTDINESITNELYLYIDHLESNKSKYNIKGVYSPI